MRKISKYYKKMNYVSIKTAVLAIIVSAFFLPSYMKFERTGNNILTVFLNGEAVGVVEDADAVDRASMEARREIAGDSHELVLADTDWKFEAGEALFGRIDSERKLKSNIKDILKQNIKETLNRSYTLKINEFTVNLSSSEDVHALLQASIDKYDSTGSYAAELMLDPNRELNVLTAKLVSSQGATDENGGIWLQAGVEKELSDMFLAVEPAVEKEFSDYDLGLKSMVFGDDVEIVEAYLPDSQVTGLGQAVEMVMKDQEKEQIYEVAPGDTLSQIALNNNLSIAALVEMNETIENENSTIRAGDEMIVTIPEPELSIERQEESYFEEDYEAEVQYIDNDQWFTTEQVTVQQPSAGHRNIVVLVSYRNDKEVDRGILKEEVVMEAVPKIVERGTKVPPTYIKPISGGRLTSSYGGRKAPTRGASTNHKGVDWATPVGTTVVASSAGTVARAGWGSGYGYVVYINHGDGRQTRYGHLSKVLVKPGQTVQQGTKIALSGNTGRSTGPHVHFEILIGGQSVNPLGYLN